MIITAGSRFPAGIRVGTITETAADDAGFGLDTRVEPAVDFSRLDFVKVIVGYSPLDAPSVEEETVEEEPTDEEPTEEDPTQVDPTQEGDPEGDVTVPPEEETQ